MQIEFARARVKVGQRNLAKLGIPVPVISPEQRERHRKMAEALLKSKPFANNPTPEEIAEIVLRFSVDFR